MKKELIISSIIAVAIIAVVLVNTKQPSTNTTRATPKSSTVTQTPTSIITDSEVAKHNTTSDCWIIIKNNAYDVTTYISAHPGGSEEIIKTCGTDATAAYATIKGGRGHSPSADSDLTTLFIGAVQ